jgi:type IV pilus assembly protein PilC
MTQYVYTAMTGAGRRVNGRMEAANVADLETRLRHVGLDLIDAVTARRRAAAGTGISRRELINFCFHLEQLADAGVPLLEALVDLRDSVRDMRLRGILAALVASIHGGKTLSQAMEEHPASFDEVMVHLVRAGEASGRLPEVLAELTASLKWQDELAAQTRRLLTYPLFLGAVMLTLLVFVAVYLMPQLSSFMKNMGQELPLQTRLLVGASRLFADYWYLLLGLPLLTAAGWRYVLRTSPRARLVADRAKLRLPLVGDILRKLVLARFAGSLAMMYGAGLPVLDSMRIGERIVGNADIADGLRHAGEMIAQGAGVTTAFERAGIFPPLVVRMLRVGEVSGGLDRALGNVGYFYSRDVRESIDRMQALIEPTMTVIIGAVMGWIMLAVLGPVYDVIARLKV